MTLIQAEDSPWNIVTKEVQILASDNRDFVNSVWEKQTQISSHFTTQSRLVKTL